MFCSQKGKYIRKDDKMNKEQTEQAIRFLSCDTVINIDMIESIRRGDAKLISVSDDGVLILNIPCEAYMMSAQNEAAANRMIDSVDNAQMFVVHQGYCTEKVRRKYGFKNEMVCHQVAYLKKEPITGLPTGITIKNLDERALPFVMEHYSHADDEEYHLERLESGVMFGAYIEDKPAGFIGMHAEGSIGMLEVLPEYRRRGVASALEGFLTNKLLDDGMIPFAQIIVGNTASQLLHRKLGFSVSDETVCWLM